MYVVRGLPPFCAYLLPAYHRSTPLVAVLVPPFLLITYSILPSLLNSYASRPYSMPTAWVWLCHPLPPDSFSRPGDLEAVA